VEWDPKEEKKGKRGKFSEEPTRAVGVIIIKIEMNFFLLRELRAQASGDTNTVLY